MCACVRACVRVCVHACVRTSCSTPNKPKAANVVSLVLMRAYVCVCVASTSKYT